MTDQYKLLVEEAFSEQDKLLTGISDGVSRLHVMSKEMNNELDTQKVIINDLENQVDNTTEKVISTTDKVKKILRDAKSDKMMWGICCVIIIIIALIILMIFIM